MVNACVIDASAVGRYFPHEGGGGTGLQFILCGSACRPRKNVPDFKNVFPVVGDIETKKGGTYTVTTDYAIAAPASTLLKIGYSVNGNLEEFTFPGTGGWTKFAKYSPGGITLPPGKCTLTVKGITSGAETKSNMLVPET